MGGILYTFYWFDETVLFVFLFIVLVSILFIYHNHIIIIIILITNIYFVSRDGGLLYTASMDNTIRMWFKYIIYYYITLYYTLYYITLYIIWYIIFYYIVHSRIHYIMLYIILHITHVVLYHAILGTRTTRSRASRPWRRRPRMIMIRYALI